MAESSLPNLDDPRIYDRYDPQGARRRLFDMAGQLRTAWELAQNWASPVLAPPPRAVLVAGMGGSAIGGDLLAALAQPLATIPILVHRGYGLPAHAGPHTLVITSSYSGNTEETLSAASEAHRRGLPLVVVTTGGELLRRARDWGAPSLTFDYPAQPRETLGYSLGLLLGVLVRLNLLPDLTPEVSAAVAVLEDLRGEIAPEVPREHNPAKELAAWLHGTLPLICGAGLLAPVARRWRTQANENSKSWAFFDELPEMDHNLVAGLGLPADFAGQVRGVFLTSDHDHPRNRLRQVVTQELLQQAGTPCRTVAARGASPLAQLLTSALLGDATSYFLAMLYGSDPTPIPAIAALKKALAGHAG